jgi:molybdopterin-containing oxidoreductase family membrane subunit
VAGFLIWAGMWCERFMIIVGSLTRSFLPSSWHAYAPTLVDWSLLVGSIGLFGLLFLTFLRWVPFMPLSELKQLRFHLAREAAGVASRRQGAA